MKPLRSAVTINSNGKERKLFYVIDSPGKHVQIVEFAGSNLGDGVGQPIGSSKSSIHSPRNGEAEYCLHLKMLVPGDAGTDPEARLFDAVQYTNALNREGRFAHVRSLRFTTLTSSNNDLTKKVNQNFVLPFNFDPATMLLMASVFVGSKESDFQVPADEEGIHLLRIECSEISIIILYSFALTPSIDYGFGTFFRTKDTKFLSGFERAKYDAIVQGWTAKEATDAFVWQTIEMLIDYSKRFVSLAETLFRNGLLQPEGLVEARQISAARVQCLEARHEQRLDAGKVGLPLPDDFDWDKI